MKQRTVKTAREALEWVETTPHHWASAGELGFFVIGNRDMKIRIPASVYAEMGGMIEPGDVLDARMYRATDRGRKVMAV